MIDKRVATIAEAIADIGDGARIMLSGFQHIGVANALIRGVIDSGVKDLTIIANGAGHHGSTQADLMETGRVTRLICSSARGRGKDSTPFEKLYHSGKIELELVPQGTLAERIRAGGAGIPAFYTATGASTDLAEGKEKRDFNDRTCVLETALTADFALLRADRGDRWGNLTYRGTQANFGPVMATAGAITVAEVTEVVDTGTLNPAAVRTPGIFVDRVIALPDLR
ncbi:MAG: 3-oxoacid CoA-transferase subunit A [Alphaproteobacteria bacterium]|nr:3-oxoacid CoA-transferase subunit A [Alphaproteobacteria bacterium]